MMPSLHLVLVYFLWRPDSHSEIWEVLNDLKLTQRSCGICLNESLLVSNDRGWSESESKFIKYKEDQH